MRTRLAFDDVLDATLRESSPAGPAEAWTVVTSVRSGVPMGTAASYGFFFGTGPLATALPGGVMPGGAVPATSRQGGVDARFAGAVHAAHTTCSGADAPRRPRRVLAAAQQRALDELVTLGAQLTSDFTAAELRSAFRMLARQYHPDRHAGVDAAARAALARQFARVHDAYRLLLES